MLIFCLITIIDQAKGKHYKYQGAYGIGPFNDSRSVATNALAYWFAMVAVTLKRLCKCRYQGLMLGRFKA